MKKYRQSLLIFFVAISMILSACSGTATTAAPTTAPTTAAVEPTVTEVPPTATVEPTVEPSPTAIPEASASDLDAAYGTFLSSMKAYNTINLEAFNEALMEDPKPFILDVREVSEAEEKGHIEGAVLIPLRELAQHVDLLPSFDTPILSYCGSGWRCTIAMTALEALGWTDVKCLKDNSFTGWVDAGYPVVEGVPVDAEPLNAAQPDPALLAAIDKMLQAIPAGFGGIAADALNTALVENPDLILVDVRTAKEVEEQGSIDAVNVINIPLEEFVAKRDMWTWDMDTPVTVYCGSGHRSTIAATILWAYGYTNVTSLKGGFGGWVAAGYPVQGGASADLDTSISTFLANMKAYNTIKLDAFNEALMSDPPPFILDVREVSEAEEKGHIEGAVLIPLRELAQHVDLLPSFDTPILSYCGSGWRCTIAMTALEVLGWQDVKCLKDNSFTGWVEAGYPVVEGVPEEAMVLNVAQPDPVLLAAVDEVLQAVPANFGGIAASDLNTALLENPDLILIDVRTDDEVVTSGVIQATNLFHIPLEKLVEMKAELPADKAASIVVYCGSGHRSTIAMTLLWMYGYTDVSSLKSGFAAWVDAGYPVAEYAAP